MLNSVVGCQPCGWVQSEALLYEVYYNWRRFVLKELRNWLTAFHNLFTVGTFFRSYQFVLVKREKVIFLDVKLLVLFGIFKHGTWNPLNGENEKLEQLILIMCGE